MLSQTEEKEIENVIFKEFRRSIKKYRNPMIWDLKASSEFGPHPLDNGERLEVSEPRILLSDVL